MRLFFFRFQVVIRLRLPKQIGRGIFKCQSRLHGSTSKRAAPQPLHLQGLAPLWWALHISTTQLPLLEWCVWILHLGFVHRRSARPARLSTRTSKVSVMSQCFQLLGLSQVRLFSQLRCRLFQTPKFECRKGIITFWKSDANCSVGSL